MGIQLGLKVDPQSPIPIRRQLTEQLKHVIDGGGIPRDQALPSIRELAGFLGINPNTVARVVDDLKRSGYVETRRGKGMFVAPLPPARPAPHLRERFLREAVIQAAARGMPADELAVGVLSVAGIRPAAVTRAVDVLFVECSAPELEIVARELETHLPVRVDKVLLGELPAVARREKHTGRWAAAVTSFCHLSEVERLLRGKAVQVVALFAGAHLETLHRLAQLPSGTRVGVASAVAETAQALQHSVASAGLPNIVLVGACPAEGAALGRLVRQVDVMVCSTGAAERVQALAGSALRVIIDERAIDQRSIDMLAAVLVGHDGDGTAAAPDAGAAVANSDGANRVRRRESREARKRGRVDGRDGRGT
ncbi:MAG: GntR family transcriptional regulator [Candidatus Rokubacteria bacterium]|nr:GntR family transcriptional regulator [Candidatus Rokubacteria bacterium]